MMDKRYNLAAEVLSYPRCDYFSLVENLRSALAARGPAEAAERLDAFADRIAALSIGELQELYTRTFDLNPVSSLEVGWHLFGENYSRGEFLVMMRQQLRRHGLEESTELPDHLTHLLCLVGKMGQAEAQPLLTEYVLPAIDKMLAGFADPDDPYREVLQAVRCLLASACAASEVCHNGVC